MSRARSREICRYNDSFAVRSGDLKWRVRLSLYKNDDKEQPYKVTFHNVMTDEKDQPGENSAPRRGLPLDRAEPPRHAQRGAGPSSRCAMGVRKRPVSVPRH